MDLPQIGKFLLIIGTVIVVAGLILIFAGKSGFLGKLPGDIIIRKGNFTFYFPFVTFLLISIVITVIVNLFIRLFR